MQWFCLENIYTPNSINTLQIETGQFHLVNSTFNQLVHMIYNIRQAPYLHDSRVASQTRLQN